MNRPSIVPPEDDLYLRGNIKLRDNLLDQVNKIINLLTSYSATPVKLTALDFRTFRIIADDALLRSAGLVWKQRVLPHHDEAAVLAIYQAAVKEYRVNCHRMWPPRQIRKHWQNLLENETSRAANNCWTEFLKEINRLSELIQVVQTRLDKSGFPRSFTLSHWLPKAISHISKERLFEGLSRCKTGFPSALSKTTKSSTPSAHVSNMGRPSSIQTEPSDQESRSSSFDVTEFT